jgi:hypothetical protein
VAQLPWLQLKVFWVTQQRVMMRCCRAGAPVAAAVLLLLDRLRQPVAHHCCLKPAAAQLLPPGQALRLLPAIAHSPANRLCPPGQRGCLGRRHTPAAAAGLPILGHPLP